MPPTMSDLLAQVRKKLERANLPWAASQEKDAPHGVCIHTAEGDLEGNIVLYDTEYLELAEAELAALAVNALVPLVEALVNKPCGCGDDGIPIHNCGAAACRRCKVLADLQEQLQEVGHATSV